MESLESVSCGEDDDTAETRILGEAGTLRAIGATGVTGVVAVEVSSPISGSCVRSSGLESEVVLSILRSSKDARGAGPILRCRDGKLDSLFRPASDTLRCPASAVSGAGRLRLAVEQLRGAVVVVVVVAMVVVAVVVEECGGGGRCHVRGCGGGGGSVMCRCERHV